MTEREIAEAPCVLVPGVTCSALAYQGQIIRLTTQLAGRDARLARLVEAAETIKREFHPKGPGHGTCLMCREAGGAHGGGCPIGLIVAALADA